MNSTFPPCCLMLVSLISLCACDPESYDDSGPQQDRSLGEDVTAIVSYSVQDGEISDPVYYDVPDGYVEEQEDKDSHQELWDYTKDFFRTKMDFVSTFTIMTDGEDEVLASVFQVETDPYAWTIAVDFADAFHGDGELDTSDLSRTLVHEFGHLLSLNQEQIPVDLELFENQDDQDIFDEKKAECETFFIQEGCTEQDAYLNTFYQVFWTELIGEFNSIDEIEDDEERDAAKADFYEEHQNQFVSDYAATNVTEDFAESWTVYVLDGRPQGEAVKDQKVRFFEDYPEVEAIRQDILESL